MAEIIVDADGHVLEPADLWEKNLPLSLRDRGIRLRWNPETGYDERFVEDWMYSDRGVAGLGNAGQSYRDLGQGTHYEDLNPAGFDPAARVKVLDAEGIDIAVLYPGLGLALGGIRDPVLAAASCGCTTTGWPTSWLTPPTGSMASGRFPFRTPRPP
jgi:hypothetical protein